MDFHGRLFNTRIVSILKYKVMTYVSKLDTISSFLSSFLWLLVFSLLSFFSSLSLVSFLCFVCLTHIQNRINMV